MMENKKSFILYADQISIFKKLLERDRVDKTNNAGELAVLMYEYVNDLNPVPVNFIVEMAFEPIKLQLKRDLLHWNDVRLVRSESGKNGGIKSGEARRKKKEIEANEPNALKSNQNEANEAVNVNVNVNETVINNTPPPLKSYDEKMSDFMGTFDIENFPPKEKQTFINMSKAVILKYDMLLNFEKPLRAQQLYNLTKKYGVQVVMDVVQAVDNKVDLSHCRNAESTVEGWIKFRKNGK